MNTLQAKIRNLEAEITTDKINLLRNKSLLTQRLANLKSTYFVPSILIGGFIVGYRIAPTTSNSTNARPRQKLFVVMTSWIRQFTQLLINLKYLSS